MEVVLVELGVVVRDRGFFYCYKFMEISLFYFFKSKLN